MNEPSQTGRDAKSNPSLTIKRPTYLKNELVKTLDQLDLKQNYKMYDAEQMLEHIVSTRTEI